MLTIRLRLRLMNPEVQSLQSFFRMHAPSSLVRLRRVLQRKAGLFLQLVAAPLKPLFTVNLYWQPRPPPLSFLSWNRSTGQSSISFFCWKLAFAKYSAKLFQLAAKVVGDGAIVGEGVSIVLCQEEMERGFEVRGKCRYYRILQITVFAK
jgi:hypothetical protein